MSLFALVKQDMNRRPALWTFAYDGLPYQPSHRRTWGEILRIRRSNQWLILAVNVVLIGVLDGTVAFLVVLAHGRLNRAMLALLAASLLLTILYASGIVKLLNYLRGAGYRG